MVCEVPSEKSWACRRGNSVLAASILPVVKAQAEGLLYKAIVRGSGLGVLAGFYVKWLGVTGALAFLYFHRKPLEAPVARFTIPPPEKTSFRFDSLPYGAPALSPDGRKLAFGVRGENGQSRLWVRSLDGTAARSLIKTGVLSRWRADGKELFYVAPDNQLMVAEMNIKPGSVEIGSVRPLFGPVLSNNGYQYDVSGDGQHFLAVLPNDQSAPEPLTLVQNWAAGLKK